MFHCVCFLAIGDKEVVGILEGVDAGTGTVDVCQLLLGSVFVV